MCILCVIQKWSRRVATMLPWLVIPLIGLWAVSQLLPPAFRFEITSPRLACVFVLLVTLFWYEILMPQLSAWRVRRNARLRERKRSEAIELQKLRKTATRRCRNCLNPYRDQNPGGGRFMCSYCGHISKRPALDLPPGLGMSNSNIVKELGCKGGKILNGRVWSENGWMCGQDWLENGNWAGGSVAGRPSSWRVNEGGLFGGDEHSLTEKPYSGVLFFSCKLLTSFFLSIRWLWRKIFRVSSSSDECSSDAEHRALLAKRGENGGNLNESRGEKARRKAEEKRQARLERELLEEEERKQREEVARLVEERRKLRDEKMEAEKDRSKSFSTREKDSRKKHQEKRKEKDKGSSKSNSDVEELEKKSGKETVLKRDLDKKGEADRRDHQKSAFENGKGQSMDNAHGKNVAGNNYHRGSTGTRYLDRMKGTIMSSSKAFGFGKGANTPATMVKENKFHNSVDHVHNVTNRRDFSHPERPAAKSNMNTDIKNINHTVLPESQPWAAPKKSWEHLFTRSSPVRQNTNSNSNVICRPNSKSQSEVKSPQHSGPLSSAPLFDNPIQFGLPSPFNISTFPSVQTSSSLGFTPAIEPFFSPVGEGPHDFRNDEQELYEDPCYVPDPASLIGPVSESIENFQLDLGGGFGTDMEVEKHHCLKNISACTEVNKPSPIESPLSREKHSSSNRFPTTPKAHEGHAFPSEDATANEKGWQLWNTSPLGQEGLGLVGCPGGWLLPSQRNPTNKDDLMQPPCQKPMASIFTKDDSIISSSHSAQNVFLPNGQSGGTFSPITGSSDYDPWLQNTFFPPLSGSLKAQDGVGQSERIYGSTCGSIPVHVREGSSANNWSKQERPIHGSVEGVGKSSIARLPIGSRPPTPDVQSLWSFD